ncbi:MAG: glycosyltransferase [Janthinobacterium lividum]
MSPDASPSERRPRRILHSVGHLSRGGIETWLYDVIRRLGAPAYEHHVLVWTREEEAFTAEFRDAGAHVHAIPSYMNPISFVSRFRDILQTHGPFDVLHTHGTHFHGFVLGLGRAARIRARLAHSHTDIRPVLDQSGPLYRAYAGAGHVAIRSFATAGRGVSEVAARSMFGPSWRGDRRFGLLHCGIDLDRFAKTPVASIRGGLGIPNGRLVLGHVGRFETQKNHRFLLDVLKALLELEVDGHLLLIGDGSLRPEFEQHAQRLGLSARVTILRDCREVPDVMASAMDAFVLPSLYEGLPLVLVEAQAAGLPCLVSEAAAIEATVVPALVRRLGLEAGAEAWATAIRTLPEHLDPDDADLRALLLASDFNIERSVSHLDQLYAAIA